MSIDINEIDKYIFDPENPRRCKSYNLLLQIAKHKNMVYVSSGFFIYFYGNEIVNREFEEKIWDKPDNYSDLSFNEKVELFIKQLSDKEYVEHIKSININSERLAVNKIFVPFFDLVNQQYIKILKYDDSFIKAKLLSSDDFTGYRNFLKDHGYQGHKILFTNKKKDLYFDNEFFDVSSIVITSDMNLFFSDPQNKTIDNSINKHIKPIFLKNIKDVDLLLNVLSNDLNKSLNKEAESEDIAVIDEIKINDFFSIEELELRDLKDKKEIYILGENGDGKTIFLQALALGLKGVNEGEVFDFVKSQSYSVRVKDSVGQEYSVSKATQIQNPHKYLFAYGANRNNSCQKKEDETGYLTLFNAGLDLKDPIGWLKYIDYSEKSGNTAIMTTQKAKQLLRDTLNREVEIEISPDGVKFVEKGSSVDFEQLSAGYKGVITIVVDLLARLSASQPYVEDIKEFQGVALIDEVELHLHPKWKYSFVSTLRGFFPKIQFFFTTHSPTVILGASKEAVFYKIYKEEGRVKISNQIPNRGYTGNTLLSSPLFDLGTIATRNYSGAISSDDYIYEKIHKVVADKIKQDIDTPDEELLKIIEDELAKL